ncbi:MAG: thiamine pyrophosphate-binding protein [Alphaproteobacteria bacterium]|nr:thiamine pyrophosphate-binding protein [Alphaproteobacteria bacterium]
MTRPVDYLARRLYEAGCRFAFGMPGGEVIALVDALDRAGIRFVLAKHETAAGFMAEGAYHRTGAPGILVATLGPGAANGVNVVANAEQDRVPLIVLTGCVDADDALTYTHQVLDHQALFKPITRATFRLTAQGADIIADKAVAIATRPRPGPVHIDIPISVAEGSAAIGKLRRFAREAPAAPAGDALDQARSWLDQARRPILIAGLDITNHHAEAALLRFVEAYRVPFITTYKAKGVIREDHPLCLGGAGLSPLADRHLAPMVAAADLVICAGYDPIEMRTGWREMWDPGKQRVIDIAAAANTHYMHQAGLNFVCDVAAGLDALATGAASNSAWAETELKHLQSALAKAFPADEPWGPAAVVDEARRCLPADTIATVDSGAHRILLSQMWKCFEPRALLQSTGLCTMGCALPLAAGAKIAEPGRPVAAFCGDAGLLMVAGELATLAELRLPVIVVVFVDASLALIEMKQRGRQLANVGVDFGLHDVGAIGRAFGGNGYTVRSRPELAAAIRDGLKADRFTVTGCIIDRRAYDGRI